MDPEDDADCDEADLGVKLTGTDGSTLVLCLNTLPLIIGVGVETVIN